jgi:quercetin 2,3-dioxygenase
LTYGATTLIYVYEGEVALGEQGSRVPRGRLARLSRDGSRIDLRVHADNTRVLVLSGQPLNEPIVQYGPFVMNTRQEIEQALDDYRRGVLAQTF